MGPRTAAAAVSVRTRWCRPKKRKEQLLLFSRLASEDCEAYYYSIVEVVYSVFHRRKRGRSFFLRPLYDGSCPALAPWTTPPLAGVFQLVHKIMHSQQPGDEEEKIQNHGGPRKGGVLHPLSLHGGGGVQFSRFGLLDG